MSEDLIAILIIQNIVMPKKAFETSDHYYQILVNNSKPILYIFLLFGINIRFKNSFEIDNPTSKRHSLCGQMAHILFCIYRVIIVLLILICTLFSLDWIYNIINVCNFEKCIRFVALSNVAWCSSVTYFYFIFKRDSISKLVQNVITTLGNQFQAFPDSNISIRYNTKVKFIPLVFVFDMILTCLTSLYLCYRFLQHYKPDTPEFFCEIYSGFLNMLECNLFEVVMVITICFYLSVVIPFINVSVIFFIFIAFLVNIHFDILISVYTNINEFLKLNVQHYVADVIKKHEESCKLVTYVNQNFSFLIFIWFVMEIFQVICLLRLNTDESLSDRTRTTILLLGMTIHFVTMCLLISSINSKVSYFS